MAFASLLVFIIGNVTFCASVSRGDAVPDFRTLTLGASLLALTTVAMLEAAKRHKERFQSLYEQATRDSLTGCLNRGAILSKADEDLRACTLARIPYSLMLCDVDRFKRINDAHGHQAGDAVLQEVVTRLKARLDSGATVGRLGGDEFLISLPGFSSESLQALALRAKSDLSPTLAWGQESIGVSLSIGAATSSPFSDYASPSPLKTLLGAADAALYAAKRGGRRTFRIAENPHQAPPLPEVGEAEEGA